MPEIRRPRLTLEAIHLAARIRTLIATVPRRGDDPFWAAASLLEGLAKTYEDLYLAARELSYDYRDPHGHALVRGRIEALCRMVEAVELEEPTP